MCPFYQSINKSPSSSAIESYFKTLKHLLFETRIHKYSVDEFLKIHLNYILGETRIRVKNFKKQSNKGKKRKLLTKKYTQCKKNKRYLKQSFSSDSIFIEKPSFTENWGGEGYTEINKIAVLFLRNGNLTDSMKYKKVDFMTYMCVRFSFLFVSICIQTKRVHSRNY